ncbi:MAG: hypothetical protein KF724_02855 [Phycisphaeraceae bacterium]|nr:hypothetical protein [Phycisphaeraceae bacterium]
MRGSSRTRARQTPRAASRLSMSALAAVALGATSPGFAGAVQARTAPGAPLVNFGVRTPAPLAVRGGVVAIELDPPSRRPGDTRRIEWPDEVPVTLSTGERLQASLGVVSRGLPRAERSWTLPAEDLEVRSPSVFLAAFDETGIGVDAALVALVETPADFAGTIEVGAVRVAPAWIDPEPAVAPEVVEARGVLRLTSGTPDLPDARSPGEYWRWVLLAQELDMTCEAPPFAAPAALLARHRAELWQAGLERVRRGSPSVAKELRELLTSRVSDPQAQGAPRLIAAWIAGAEELASLLAILLDRQRNDEATMRAALGWMESRSPLTVWLESDAGASITLVAANPLPVEAVVRCAWLEAPAEVPVALLIPPHGVARTRIERPIERVAVVPGQPRGEPLERWRGGLTLRLESGRWRGRLVVGPGIFSVRPPGLGFAAFVPPLSLASAQSQRIEPDPTPWRTTASIRKLARRWELFIECLRPEPVAGDQVIVTVGDPAGTPARFSVNEQGAITMLSGGAMGGLAAHAGRYADRWRVRVELPDSWIPEAELGSSERLLFVGLERQPGAGRSRQTAGLPVPAWSPPAPICTDLGAWIDMPAPAGR